MIHRSRTAGALALAAAFALGACSSDDSTSTNASTVSTAAGAAPETGQTASTAAGATPAAPSSGFDICATVPSLDVINTQVDEPVTTVWELDRGPGEEVCEAYGEGLATVQFSVLDPSDRDTVVQIATDLGSPPVDLNDPALPGAIGYAGSATVFVGERSYTVQVITMDTIGDPNSPVALQRSATLLAAWLQNMGVAL